MCQYETKFDNNGYGSPTHVKCLVPPMCFVSFFNLCRFVVSVLKKYSTNLEWNFNFWVEPLNLLDNRVVSTQRTSLTHLLSILVFFKYIMRHKLNLLDYLISKPKTIHINLHKISKRKKQLLGSGEKNHNYKVITCEKI